LKLVKLILKIFNCSRTADRLILYILRILDIERETYFHLVVLSLTNKIEQEFRPIAAYLSQVLRRLNRHARSG
jgi:hypothetical protein